MCDNLPTTAETLKDLVAWVEERAAKDPMCALPASTPSPREPRVRPASDGTPRMCCRGIVPSVWDANKGGGSAGCVIT